MLNRASHYLVWVETVKTTKLLKTWSRITHIISDIILLYYMTGHTDCTRAIYCNLLMQRDQTFMAIQGSSFCILQKLEAKTTIKIKTVIPTALYKGKKRMSSVKTPPPTHTHTHTHTRTHTHTYTHTHTHLLLGIPLLPYNIIANGQ